MKKLVKTLVGLSLAAVMTFGTFTAAYAADNNGITVNGRGVVMVDPDTAKIYADIETTAATASDAQNENNRISEGIKFAMLDAGIADENILTESSYVYPERTYDENLKKSVTTGYRAYTTLSFKTDDIRNAGKYMDVALKSGATGSSVSFYLEDSSIYYADALKEAVKSAENSAKAIAEACGVTLNGIVSVDEMSSNYSVADTTAAKVEYEAMAAADSAANGGSYTTDIGYDKISITASVSITYGI